MAVTHRRNKSRGRIVTIWIVSVVVAVVLFAVLWIAIRALMARDELLGAIPLAQSIGSTAISGSGASISSDVAELQDRAARAASLTSDPIWRTVEYVPVLGGNLTAFRQAAAMIDDVASDALPPLSALADTFTLDSLAPKNGAFDLQPFIDASPKLSDAREALDDADGQAANIDTSGTISQIGEAVDQLVELVGQAKDVVGSLDVAASLLPPMLGADGPRSYLLLSLNNSELRATGGIPGAIAVINVDNGVLSLGELSSANELGEFAAPVLPLTEAETTLYQDILGTYMQDVNFTPNFARSGELAQAMWETRTGQRVDGVLALDPVALGYILSATGPIDAGANVTLNDENAADILLSGVYSMFEEPEQQDAFFAEVTSRIFLAVTGGGVDNSKLLDSLTDGVDEGRIHLWASNSEEQSQIAKMAIAGTVPESSSDRTAFGVYFNDGTGAKMDYYLRGAIGIASAVCRNDERPNFDVRVRLTSTAPADADDILPEYVTGKGQFNVIPGDIRTNVFVYAPAGSVPYSVTINGEEYAFVAAEDSGHSVAGITVDLGPGESAEVAMQFVGVAGDAEAILLEHTPMSSDVATSVDNVLDCGTVAPAPVEGDEEQSGAMGVLSDNGAARAENDG